MSRTPPVSEAINLTLVALGGVLGALLRDAAGHLGTTGDGALPWTILVINVTGTLVLGAVVGGLHGGGWHHRLRVFLGPGLCSGYTTFSTYAVGAATLVHDGHTGVAVTYVVLTTAITLAAGALGFAAGHRARPNPEFS